MNKTVIKTAGKVALKAAAVVGITTSAAIAAGAHGHVLEMSTDKFKSSKGLKDKAVAGIAVVGSIGMVIANMVAYDNLNSTIINL